MKTFLVKGVVAAVLITSTFSTGTIAIAQGINYYRSYSTTANAMSNRAAMRAALKKARLRKAKKSKTKTTYKRSRRSSRQR